MDCYTTQGYIRTCKDAQPGVRRVLLANKSHISSITPVFGSTGTPDEGLITDITMTSTNTFFEFIPAKNLTTFNEVSAESLNTAPVFTQTLTMSLINKRDSVKRNLILMLAKSELVGIVEHTDGSYTMIGEVNGLDVTATNYSSGAAPADTAIGWVITFTGNEPEPGREVDPTIIDALLPV